MLVTFCCFVSAWHMPHYNKVTLHYITWHLSLHGPSHKIVSFTLHYITLHHITSHHITSHHITSHHITSHHITLHYITLHYITIQRNVLLNYLLGPVGGAHNFISIIYNEINDWKIKNKDSVHVACHWCWTSVDVSFGVQTHSTRAVRHCQVHALSPQRSMERERECAVWSLS